MTHHAQNMEYDKYARVATMVTRGRGAPGLQCVHACTLLLMMTNTVYDVCLVSSPRTNAQQDTTMKPRKKGEGGGRGKASVPRAPPPNVEY